jgi:hemolysin activation/secretion protein
VLELRQGIHAFGATDCGTLSANCVGAGHIPPSRLEARSDATLLRYSANGEYRPAPHLTFALGILGQHAWEPLLSFEQFAAGNYTAGRGYDPGSLLGDSGFGSQAEIRVGTVVPPATGKAALEGYGFWDYAHVHSRGPVALVEGSQHLDSIGGGVRVNFDRFALDGALAVPLTHIGVDRKRPGARVLVSLTTRLWPWSYQ